MRSELLHGALQRSAILVELRHQPLQCVAQGRSAVGAGASPGPQQSERMTEAVDRKAEEARVRADEDSLAADDRNPEQLSVRARSSGHGKKTADKWNQ